MDYIIPEYLKKEIFSGELSKRINYVIYHFNYSLYPSFEVSDIDDFEDRFKAYICYNAISMGDDLEQLLYVEVLNAFSIDTYLPTLVDKFIKITIESNKTYEELLDNINTSQKAFASMVRNCFCKQFLELSDKSSNDHFRADVDYYVKRNRINVNKDFLLTLSKCAIIESRRKPELDLDFHNFSEAIDYAFNLYKEQLSSFEDRKQNIDRDREIMDFIDRVLDENDFSR